MNKQTSFSKISLTLSFLLAFNVNANDESNNVTPQIKFNIVSPGPHSLPLADNTNDVLILAANGSNTQTAPKSAFYKNSINFSKLTKKSYSEQVSDYIVGNTPYMRGSYESIVQLASDVSTEPELKPVVIYQFNEAVGDMVLVVESSIKHLSDLCGKEIVASDNGYSIAMLSALNSTHNCDDKPSIKWSTNKDVLETLSNGRAEASFVSIYSLMNADLEKGKYHILLDDSVAPELSGDVLVVRSDFYESRRYLVDKLVKGIEQSKMKIQIVASDSRYLEHLERLSSSMSILMTGSERVTDIVKNHLIRSFGSTVNSNVLLFDRQNKRYFDDKVSDAQETLKNLGITRITTRPALGDMYDELLSYDEEMKYESQYNINRSTDFTDTSMFRFSVDYDIDQTDFSQSSYKEIYDKIIDLLKLFPGTSLVVTGHSDPINFIRALDRNASFAELNMIKQVDKNHSLILAELVKASLLNEIESKNIDAERISIFTRGKGISEPKTGICDLRICEPKNWSEWKSNMRVSIDVIPTASQHLSYKEGESSEK